MAPCGLSAVWVLPFALVDFVEGVFSLNDLGGAGGAEGLVVEEGTEDGGDDKDLTSWNGPDGGGLGRGGADAKASGLSGRR